MLCTSNIHSVSLGNYLGTSLIIGNLMMIRVASVDGIGQGQSGLLLILLSDYELEDVYNMDETGLYSKAHLNKTLAKEKVKGRKLQRERVTLALAINSTRPNKLKLLVIYTSKQPGCFGRWQPHEYVRWHSNKTAWILQLNNQFRGQNQKVIMILDDASSHVVSSAKVSKSRGFQPWN